jgi:hypothetical protein
MNLRIDAPVFLRARCPHTSEGLRERVLTALVAHFEVVSVHEFEDQDGMCVEVSLGERAWHTGYDDWEFGPKDLVAPLDAKWRRYPELTP